MTEKVSSSGELRYFECKLSPKLKQVRLIPLSDFHKGNPLCSDKHILRQRDFIRDNDSVVTVLNGDLCEAVTKQSKGEIYHQLLTPQEQRDWVIELLLPIKNKVLGVTRGNHETRIWNETGIDICEDIAKALGAPYRAEGILLKIVFGGNNSRHPNKPYSYFIYMTHGYGGARTKSAKAVKVERLGTWIHADCYLMSHDHVVNVAPDIYLFPDNRTTLDQTTGFTTGKIKAHRKMLVKTGAFLKWGSYAEAGGFPPVDLSQPIIMFAGTGKPRVSVLI